MEVSKAEEPSIQFNLHSCYYNDFFLLRTLITINGTPAEIKIDQSGASFIQHSETGIEYSISRISRGIAGRLVEKHGLYHVDTFYHDSDQAALFSVVFLSQSALKQILENKETVESDLAEVLLKGLTSRQDQSVQSSESVLQVSVVAELFLVSPKCSDQQEKPPPGVFKVTLATFEHFVAKWQESKLFDFNSTIFSEENLASPPQEAEEAKLKDLQRELKGVDTWFQFGLELDIPDDELRIIRRDKILLGAEECLLEVLIHWRDREKPTWTKVVQALVKIRRYVLAENVAKKYGIDVPQFPAIVTRELSECDQHDEDVERQLSCKQHDLDTAVLSRDKLIGNIETDLSTKLIELQGENSSLAEEIECLKQQLEYKTKVSEYIEESQKKMKNIWKETIERMKKELNEQIEQLKQQLTSKSQQLAQIQEQLWLKEKELDEKVAELEEKSSVVQQLQKEVEALKESFREQRQEMNLRQIESTASSISKDKHLEEVKLQLENVRYEANVKSNEIKKHTQEVANMDKQISQLSAIIKENEAKLNKLQEEEVLSEDQEKMLKLSLRVKLIHLREQLKDTENSKWMSEYRLRKVQEDLLKYKSAIPDLSKCTVNLPQKKLKKHTLSRLRVCLFDEDGDPCSGSHHIDTTLTLLADDSTVAGTVSKPVKDNYAGEYVVRFTPTRAGKCEIQVTVNGTPLPSEPLSVMVYNSPNASTSYVSLIMSHCNQFHISAEKDRDSVCHVILLDTDSEPYWVGSPSETDHEAQLVVTPGNKEHDHQVTAELIHCKSKSTLSCDVYVDATSCKIVYQPRKRGKHQLSIRINGEDIQGSPLTIAVTSLPLSLEQPLKVIRNLNRPFFVTTNSQDQIIVTEWHLEADGHVVSVFSPEGKKINTFGSEGKRGGEFRIPAGVTVDNEDNIYVVDNNNHRIQKFTSDGKFIELVGMFGSGPLQFHSPLGVAFNGSGKFYICNQGNNSVQVLNNDLSFGNEFGKKGSRNGEFEDSKDIHFDSHGFVYVTDHYNHRVQIFNPDGTYIRELKNKTEKKTLHLPMGIAIDSNDTVYVGEERKGCISVFSAKGDFVDTISFRSMDDTVRVTKIMTPIKITGLHVDKNDSIYVCDFYNNQLLIF